MTFNSVWLRGVEAGGGGGRASFLSRKAAVPTARDDCEVCGPFLLPISQPPRLLPCDRLGVAVQHHGQT